MGLHSGASAARTYVCFRHHFKEYFAEHNSGYHSTRCTVLHNIFVSRYRYFIEYCNTLVGNRKFSAFYKAVDIIEKQVTCYS